MIVIYILIGIGCVALLWLILLFLYLKKEKKDRQVLEELNLTLPHSWKELTDQQLLYVCTLMQHANTPTEIHTKCFLYFAGIIVQEQAASGRWICFHRKKRFVIWNYEVQSFAKKLSFLTDTISEVKPLPHLCGYSPINARFEGCPLRQWMAAENYYQAYIYTGKEDFLDRLCAVIYTSGLLFDDNETEIRSQKFKKSGQAYKLATFIFYAGLKERLSKEFPYFFQRAATLANDAGDKQPPKMREHFSNIIYALTGGQVGNTEQVLDAECWRAFDMLNRKAHESKEIESRMQKMKKK